MSRMFVPGPVDVADVDAEDRVIESFEGLDERLPWMRLAEWSGPPA